MRYFNIVLCVLIVLAISTFAEAQPRAIDFGVGYSFLHDGTGHQSLNGWTASVGRSIRASVGLVATVDGHYFTKSAGGLRVHTSSFTYAAGPRFMTLSGTRVTPFAQMLAGGEHVVASVQGLGGSTQSMAGAANAFVLQPGFGIDTTLAKHVRARVQADYRFTRSAGMDEHFFRVCKEITD